MELIKDILTNYWIVILVGLFFIASLILQLIKKKPVNDIQSLLFEWSLVAINKVENLPVKGVQKLTVAVRYVLDQLKGNFPELNVDLYREVVIGIIEDILSTPQKHT